MLSLFRALMPKEDRFFDLFERHAAEIVKGAAGLRSLLDGTRDVASACRVIADHEEQADVITQEALTAVRKSFITPFDRSDVQGLVTALDDTIDQMKKTGKAVELFEVASFQPAMRQMGEVIQEAAAVMAETVPLLRAVGRNAADINGLTERIIALEGRADDIHNAGMKSLYLASTDTPMAFIVGSEIYDHLEKVMDRFEDAANRISSIVIEHV